MPASVSETQSTACTNVITLLSPMEGWLVPLEEIPDPVFAGRILGHGIAIDPTVGALHAPCDGTIASVAATGHAVTLATADGAQLLMHIGIDTVSMEGVGFTPLVVAGQSVQAGEILVHFDLDQVVCAATSAMTPFLLLESPTWTLQSLRADGSVAIGEPILTITAREPGTHAHVPAADFEGAELTRSIVIPLRHGLHARPSARLRQCAMQFDTTARIEYNGRSANLRSPVALLALGVRLRDTITIHAHGVQAREALDALEALIASGMGELADAGEMPTPLTNAIGADTATSAMNLSAWPSDAILPGVSAAPGIALGRATHHRLVRVEPPAGSGNADIECTVLDSALTSLGQSISDELRRADHHVASILAAHASMLEDEDLRTAAHDAIFGGASAGAAWQSAIGTHVDVLLKSGDPRLAERADDMRDLERRVLARLAGIDDTAIELPEGAVLIARDLLPSQVMTLDRARLTAIVLAQGGPTSHVAILAAGMGVPMLVAVGPLVETIEEGSQLVVDAHNGRLEAAPSAERIAQVNALRAQRADRIRAAQDDRAPCISADGTRIEIFANLGSAADAHVAMANGAEGSGLVRSEFLFADRAHAPGVAEQRCAYQEMATILEGRPMIVRLLDVGGDKPVPFLPIGAEENPALGLRGIRVSLTYPQLLEDQVEAILRVTPAGQCRIMVPMVASLSELREVRRVADDIAARIGLVERPQVGIMVETPAAAIGADILASEADFLSIGTNDLTQYTLAMDRGNSRMASSVDGLHPAVLRLIARTCDGAQRSGRWTGVCGSLASDPVAVPLLLGLGVTELSASAALVAEIKALVTRLCIDDCRTLAQRALDCSSPQDVRALVAAFETEIRA